jgi:arsenate reductase
MLMADVQIFHNPACSKSRGTLEILREQGLDADVVEYLKAPPDRPTLEHILDSLDGPVAELVRRDNRFKELGLDPAGYTDREAVLGLLLEHPELMERPVVVRGDRAVIGRPPERVRELLA